MRPGKLGRSIPSRLRIKLRPYKGGTSAVCHMGAKRDGEEQRLKAVALWGPGKLGRSMLRPYKGGALPVWRR
jgi:hypothetical protein